MGLGRGSAAYRVFLAMSPAASRPARVPSSPRGAWRNTLGGLNEADRPALLLFNDEQGWKRSCNRKHWRLPPR
jgi:hypothetical protein